MKMSPRRLLIARLAVLPPGSFQTTTASAMTIAMLRMCVPRSGPTTWNDSRPQARVTAAARGRQSGGGHDIRRGRGLGLGLGLGHSGPHGGRLGRGRGQDRLGREPVADAEVRVDVAP